MTWSTEPARGMGGYYHHLRGLSGTNLLRCTREEALKLAAADDLLNALQECQAALEWVVEQGGGPQCEHEGGVVCFCKENNAINTARAARAKALGEQTT